MTYEDWTSGNRTLVPADIGKHVWVTGSATITIPQDASAFGAGEIKFTKLDNGSGTIRIVCEGAGAYLNEHAHITLQVQNCSATVIWTGSAWRIADHTSAHMKGAGASGVHRTMVASEGQISLEIDRDDLGGVIRMSADTADQNCILPTWAEIGQPAGGYANTCSVGTQRTTSSSIAYMTKVFAPPNVGIYPHTAIVPHNDGTGDVSFYYEISHAQSGLILEWETDNNQWNLKGY